METLTARQIALLDRSVSMVLPRLNLNGLNQSRLFITGGTGFFGLWLLSALRELCNNAFSLEVTVLSRDPELFLSRFPQFCNQSWLNFLRGDVRSFEIPQTEFDLILHGAAETSRAAHADAYGIFDDIVIGTRRVLELARKSGVRRVLLISSGAVYGPQPSNMLRRMDDSEIACNPLSPGSAYGEGKRVMELLGAMLHESSAIDFVVARCFAFCGPALPLNGHFAIGNFVRDALFRETITVQGDGVSIRSYLFGADLAVWLLYLLIKGQSGMSYNVGNDEFISISELASRVGMILAPSKPVKVLQKQGMDLSARQRYVPDIARARALGCVPWTSLDDAIHLTGDFWQSA